MAMGMGRLATIGAALVIVAAATLGTQSILAKGGGGGGGGGKPKPTATPAPTPSPTPFSIHFGTPFGSPPGSRAADTSPASRSTSSATSSSPRTSRTTACAVANDPSAPAGVRAQSWLWTSTDGVNLVGPARSGQSGRRPSQLDVGDEGDIALDDAEPLLLRRHEGRRQQLCALDGERPGKRR